MATIKGENLRIMIGDDEQDLQCIAASTNCQIHLALQVEEDTTKDDDETWLTKSPVGINWDASVDALIVENDSEDDAVTADMLQVGRVYLLRFTQTVGAAGEKNRDAVANEIQSTGSAILSDLQQTSQNQEATTFTAQFTGTGDLEPYEEPEEESEE
jgi:hypothetical protein